MECSGCCDYAFHVIGVLVYGFQVGILHKILAPFPSYIEYFGKNHAGDPEHPLEKEKNDYVISVYAVFEGIMVLIFIAWLVGKCTEWSRLPGVWLGWLLYSILLFAKLVPIYVFVAKFTDAEPTVGSNFLKSAVAGTSVIYLCLTQVFFHDVGHQVSDTGRQVSDVGRQVSDVDNQVSDGRAQSDQTPPPPRSVDRMTMGVVFDIIDNAELLDLLLKDGRRGGEENQDTIGDHLGIAFAVFGALAFCLPTLALYSLHACVAKQEKAETNVTPSVTTSLLSGDNKRSFTWWKKFYLVSSFFFNVCFLILRIVAAARGNAEVGIFISKNIIFLIAYGLEILETRRPAASEGTGTGDGQDGERVT
eukprot:scpid73129/ scgid5028/ 